MCKAVSLAWHLQHHFKVAPFIFWGGHLTLDCPSIPFPRGLAPARLLHSLSLDWRNACTPPHLGAVYCVLEGTSVANGLGSSCKCSGVEVREVGVSMMPGSPQVSDVWGCRNKKEPQDPQPGPGWTWVSWRPSQRWCPNQGLFSSSHTGKGLPKHCIPHPGLELWSAVRSPAFLYLLLPIFAGDISDQAVGSWGWSLDH